MNDASLRLFGARDKTELLVSLHRIFLPETEPAFVEQLVAIAEGERFVEAETRLRTLRGERLDVLFTVAFPAAAEDLSSVLVTVMDISDRKRFNGPCRRRRRRWRCSIGSAAPWRPSSTSGGRCRR